ncbi:hypothetical protein H5410_046857 [Solanum commersonii]|uniref:Uncharacterized protein n=1 Tax=Solanum commersonii TaxID=4109 RepID=A0A9J5XFK7_SOLCO|nr:hypothetical protein H5410_046857 [Solanum commersonii]
MARIDLPTGMEIPKGSRSHLGRISNLIAIYRVTKDRLTSGSSNAYTSKVKTLIIPTNHSLLTSLVGHHSTQHSDNIPELNICELSLWLHFWCIGDPLILGINISPGRTTLNNSS